MEREYPDRAVLEKEGVEVYELSSTESGQRWRVKKGSVLCPGESRLESDSGTTREVTEIEIHGLVKGEDPKLVPAIREDMRTLPVLVAGKARYRLVEGKSRTQ